MASLKKGHKTKDSIKDAAVVSLPASRTASLPRNAKSARIPAARESPPRSDSDDSAAARSSVNDTPLLPVTDSLPRLAQSQPAPRVPHINTPQIPMAAQSLPGTWARAPSVVTEYRPAQVMDPWRRAIRVLAGCAAGASVVMITYNLLPPARVLVTDRCLVFARWSGDALAQARITANRGAPHGAAIAAWETLRVIWSRYPATRAIIVASAPWALKTFVTWLMDHTALVARATREALRPCTSSLRRRRRWQHAAVESLVLASGAATAATAVLSIAWMVSHTPTDHFVSDTQSFVAREGGPAAASKLQEALRADRGRHPLAISLWWALPLIPSAYPDVTASAAWCVAESSSAIRHLAGVSWNWLVALRTNLTLSANDDDDMVDSPVP